MRLAFGMAQRDISKSESFVKSNMPWDLESFKRVDLDSRIGVSRNETR